jgi:serine/threonine protein kinase
VSVVTDLTKLRSFLTVYCSSLQVIRKQLKRGEKSAAVFQKELENLSILTHLEHDNIVRLFCSYVFRETFNLIFAVADGGSLADLLNGKRETRAPEASQLLLALAGLASAIDAMHNFTSEALDLSLSGCHHDLAPRNILINGETFLLADFGLSSFRNTEEDSLTTFREVRGSYVAPECQKFRDGRVQTEKVGRASDIWSFGCILSEVLTYTVLGPKGVAEFREKRKFEVTPGIEWFRFHGGPETPNPEVSFWLDDLQANGEPYRVRVVDLIRKMLSMDPDERPRSAQVLAVLRGISILSIASSINHGNTRPGVDYILEELRLQSWLRAFTKLLDESVQDKEGKFDFDFPKIVQALKEIHRIVESREEGTSNTKHQQKSLLRYQHARLIESLPPNYRSVAREYLVEQVLQNHDTEKFSGLSTVTTEAGGEDIGVLVAVKHLTALAEAGLLIEQENLILDQSDIAVTAEIDIHSLALHGLASEPVVVEWLRYREPWADERVGDELRRRLASVVGLFHSEDAARIPGSLRCKGIFHDPSSAALGVVYGIPCSERQPVTLHKLLSAGKTHRPPLELRFRLAFDICECIYMFHKVGWLHRNLHSMNVLFFPPKEAENVEWARDPRIFGFAGSRENRLDSFSYGPSDDFRLRQYQHPEYLIHHERYREEFDYYSVGMILLEIGLWNTLCTITKSDRFQGLSNEQFRREIIARMIPELRIAMGTRFMEATRACLEGGFVGRSGDLASEGDTWYMSFKSLVMDRIPLIG